MKQQVIAERNGYRFVDVGELENGFRDYRLLEHHSFTNRWRETYLFDNAIQMQCAIEDGEYCKWLTGKPAYGKDRVVKPY